VAVLYDMVMNPSSPQFYYLEGDPSSNPSANGLIPFIEFAVESVVDEGSVYVRMYSREGKGTRIFSSGVEGPLPSFVAAEVNGRQVRLHADIPLTLAQARLTWRAFVRQGWRVPPHAQNESVTLVDRSITLTPQTVERIKTAMAAKPAPVTNAVGMSYALHA